MTAAEPLSGRGVEVIVDDVAGSDSAGIVNTLGPLLADLPDGSVEAGNLDGRVHGLGRRVRCLRQRGEVGLRVLAGDVLPLGLVIVHAPPAGVEGLVPDEVLVDHALVAGHDRRDVVGEIGQGQWLEVVVVVRRLWTPCVDLRQVAGPFRGRAELGEDLDVVVPIAPDVVVAEFPPALLRLKPPPARVLKARVVEPRPVHAAGLHGLDRPVHGQEVAAEGRSRRVLAPENGTLQARNDHLVHR